MPEQEYSGLWSLLVLAVLGLFAWNAAPLWSARPPGDDLHGHRSETEVPARLWQDPLHAVQRHLESGGRGDLPDCGHVPGIELERPGPVRVLVAPLTTGSYPETEERRRRRRFAVVSALADGGFAPRSSTTLSIRHCDDVLMAYEWYDPEGLGVAAPSHQVLVLWLEETWLGENPFGKLDDLTRTLLKDAGDLPDISWVLLGPSQSGTLQKLVSDLRADGLCPEETGPPQAVSRLPTMTKAAIPFHIVSPVATVDDASLLEGAGCRGEGSLQQYFTRLGLDFTRTVRSDQELVRELSRELTERHRWSEGRDKLVVLSEWDTLFGRELPATLVGADEEVWRYSYVRGLDGIVDVTSPSVSESDADKASEGDTSLDTDVRRPFGRNQYDYLRRLAERIRRDHHRSREETGHGVRAVAILGSDVYDKLLVLRALRSELPGALWLTTDLDANLLHPEERRFARNLVVASTYGFRPPDGVTSHVAPFRDSYQTSTYVATRLAVDSTFPEVGPLLAESPRDGCDEDQCVLADGRLARTSPCLRACLIPEPQLFEVGTRVAVPLTTTADAPTDALGRVTHVLVGAVSLLVFGTALGFLAAKDAAPVLYGVGAVAAIFLFVFVAAWTLAPEGEPLNLTAGVSVWPTVLIRALAAATSVVLIRRLLRLLRRNADEIEERYIEPKDPAAIASRDEAKLPPTLWSLAGLFVLLLVAFVWIQNDAWHVATWGIVLKTLLVVGIFFLWLDHISTNLKVRWLSSAANPVGLQGVWDTYRRLGAGRHRLLRSASFAILYAGIASLVLSVFGDAAAPVRGLGPRLIYDFVTGTNVLLMTMLVFLVVDAILLSLWWLGQLENTMLGKSLAPDGRHLPSLHARWLKVRLIGERTSAVSRALYYPLIVVLLMLLSRSTAFDGFELPVPLALAGGLNLALALGAAAVLVGRARAVRDAVVDRLERDRRQLDVRDPEGKWRPTREQVDEVIDELRTMNVGAFRPFWQLPLLRILAIVATGVLLVYTEYGFFVF